jgi:hypothetical protein
MPSALVTATLVAGLTLAGAGSAHADPFNCEAYKASSRTTNAICHSGTGAYRARAECFNPHPAGNSFFAHGPIVRIGQISTARCGGIAIVGDARVQIMER